MSDNLMKVSYAPMSADERAKLKKGFIFLPIFAIFSGGIFYVMFTMAGGTDDFFSYVITGFACIFALVIFWIARGIILDLIDNEKKIIQGVVTHKDIHTHRSKKGGTSRTYYLYFGKKSMRVEPHIYHQFDSGDLVEIHQAKRVYNVIFKTEKLKSGVLPDQVTAHKKRYKENQQRLGRWAILIFLGVVLVVLTGVFTAVTDCFYCPPSYPQSIMDWTADYEPNENVQDEIEKSGEQIIDFFNDQLRDDEELIIQEIFYNASSGDQLNDLIIYLESVVPQPTDERTAMNWLRYKFDERTKIYQKNDVPEMWKRVVYNVFGIKAFEPSYVVNRNKTKYQDFVKGVILTNQSISPDGVETFFGQVVSNEDLQLQLLPYIPEDSSHYSTVVRSYFKKVFGQPCLQEEEDQERCLKMKEKFGIKP